NLTFAMAILVMVMVWVTGVRVRGRGYFRHFVEPYPAMLPLYVIEELTKPVTLSLRLFGNILAGTVMVSVLALMPVAVLWLPTAAWKLFDLFIGLLQALIFALLTILYFGFAAGGHEEAG
ncbi:MAG: F0F1 ATP synthase subunit A, partial [Pseudonocardiales bacterium]|nr:F0F1 ATP synthase subunit A [Pseudonocardiales bacterium]